jgi:hypothetical protein
MASNIQAGLKALWLVGRLCVGLDRRRNGVASGGHVTTFQIIRDEGPLRHGNDGTEVERLKQQWYLG